ncbi:odorant receptor 131-2-like isoform X2 [Anguilla anguilla]|uniref:odorant receptor 131-2-like isoform X2 n=1 Tax=Anguilla anguilla TaxID=7936 RepID=UPI0015ACF12C|nr:odorant receptor 131-2-like isoform X2 [Anguilla anguilla]
MKAILFAKFQQFLSLSLIRLCSDMADIFTAITSNITVSNINKGVPAKAVLSMTPSFFFLYINVVMLITLRSKAIFRETSRLAVMALERYIAICFPLRHAEITTCRRTGMAIAIVWALGSVQSFTSLIWFLISGPLVSTSGFCSRLLMPALEVYSDINNTFTIIYFLSVGITIVYTYIGIVVAARSVSSNKLSAAKAHRTVLLHLIQLGLCLSSILFDTIVEVVRARLDLFAVLHLQYILFLGLIILPRCLSPLIYGLRDQTFRPLFIYYVTFGLSTTCKELKISVVFKSS